MDDQALLSEHPDPMESSIWSDAGFDLGNPEKEELDGDPHADEHQIGLDTDRSFVLYPVGEQPSFPAARPSLMPHPTLY